MAAIKNVDGLTLEEINIELRNGGKFVIFKYCISIIFMTFRLNSDIYFIKAGESTIRHCYGFTFISFILGWWGIPWGPIYTIGTIYTNLTGGKNVTHEVIASMNLHSENS